MLNTEGVESALALLTRVANMRVVVESVDSNGVVLDSEVSVGVISTSGLHGVTDSSGLGVVPEVVDAPIRFVFRQVVMSHGMGHVVEVLVLVSSMTRALGLCVEVHNVVAVVVSSSNNEVLVGAGMTCHDLTVDVGRVMMQVGR